ncbi:MAG: stage V sporulation protein K, partial [Lachnospiraceae bacterium]|nr:stage V sporulation protein K [Lachnospiraceae bacterium]
MDNFETLMGGAFSSGKPNKVYTDDEINAAKKRQKKAGGTLLENLEAVTGRALKTNYDLDKELDELNRNLMNDFGRLDRENREIQEKIGLKTVEAPQNPVKTDVGPEDLDGVETEVAKKVFGQDRFLKKLLIAFKRPYVLPPEKGRAKNTVFVTGREDTGKHTALTETVKELAKRHILHGSDVKFMDLSLYPNPGFDKVFLQDLYEALSSGCDVIAFEKFEACHISYLSYLSSLVMTGACRLSERYTLQNGQLLSVSNAFASKAVGEFSAAGKYLVFISTKGVDRLANQLGAPFINALGDICKTEEMEEESYRKVSKVELKQLKERAKSNLKFELTGEVTPIVEAGVRMSDRNAGVTGILKFYKDLLKSLAALRLEKSYPAGTTVQLTVEENRVIAVIGEEKIDLLGQLPIGYSGELEEVKAELGRIVGLEKIKQYIFGLEEYYAAQKRRKDQGLK